MSDYNTSITDLYNLKEKLVQLKAEEARILEELAIRETLKWRRLLQNTVKLIVQTEQEIKDSIIKLYADPLTDPLLQIEESNPVILLPLRIETRFVSTLNELWIRVFPDEIAIHSHESALTTSEIKAGSYYWSYLWKNRATADFNTHRKTAWSQLANRFGVNRTKWIVLKTTPLKLLPGDNFGNVLTEADLDPGTIETKYQTWAETVRSYVMPDLLKLRLYIGGKIAFEADGNPVIQPLPVSPDPRNTSSPAGTDWKGTNLEWLEDFNKAVEAGIAFKIDLSAVAGYDPATGFNLITVMGIRTLWNDSPLVVPPVIAGTRALSSLLENHQYTTRGLALVSQGTPTNNSEERRSGFSEQLVFSEEKYLQNFQQFSQATNPDEMEDGMILARALGVDPALFQKLENSLNTDHKDAVSMNKALFPATLGFFLRHLLHPLFKPEELDTIRSFFCAYVTGRGPVPVLRNGPQPYGILPTSNFRSLQWIKADTNYKLFQQLTDLLSKLDAVYESEIPNIPKSGQPKDPHSLLDEILGLYPNSETFYQRIGYSENFLRNCLGQAISANPNPLLEQLIQAFSTFTGMAPEGILELKKIVFERATLPLDRNKTVDIVPAHESKNISIPSSLSPAIHRGENYIGWLSRLYTRAPLAQVENDYFAGTDPRIDPPLLYPLLKQSMLLQLSKCVFHWLTTHSYLKQDLTLFHNGTPASDFMGSKEYLNLFLNREDISPMELLLIEEPNLPFLATNETAAAYLLNNADSILTAIIRIFRRRVKPEILNDFRYLKEFLQSLEYLAGLSTARLERAMIEHLDCLTYRLDAWQTALCYKKLEMNRKSGIAAGTVMGAYGWLENLKPASNIKWIKETDLPTELQPGTGKPVIQADNHAGYIHAPSLTQAKTAALLRNAYLHYHDANDPQMMAINLSSGRVRKGLEIFEGIQKGHAINELLGYRLERHLHDQSTPLDKYIPYLRAAFPLGGKILANAGDAHEQSSITQANKPADWTARLDGLAIVNAIKSGKTYPFNIAQLPSAGVEAGLIQEGIDELADCIDAMKDLLVAESIHQVVQGNTDRAGALLKSIHELKAPSKFEFIQTPRTPAEILTHRASLFFKPGDFEKPLNPWPKVNMSQRAKTEPGLNEWLAEMIGPPDLFQCTVTETKSRTNAIITIEDLDLQPIDLVYMAPTEFNKDNSEFSRRIAYYYRTTQNISEETTIEIDYNATVKNSPSLADLLPLLKLLKELVTGSKALDAADFDLKQYNGKTNFKNLSVEKSGAAITDIGSLLKRISSLTTSLQSLLKKLDQTFHARSATMCADIRKSLIACCDFEIRDAFPVSSFGEDQLLRDALIKQGTEVMSQMQKMLDSIPAKNDVNVEALLKVFAVFFGPAFKVLPVFHFSKKEDDEINRVSFVEDAANAENAIFSFITGKTNMGREKHVEQWLSELSYMRPKLASFELVRTLHDSLHEKQVALHLMQLPYEKNDSWLGVEFPEDMQTGKGKLSVLYHYFPQGTVADWKSSEFSGLLLDEWVEEIPGSEELTGISFQYNQPDSQPPQAMLLAISPTEGKKWNWDILNDIVNDTLRRAKQRAVGTKELAKTDWIGMLPGALAEFSDTKANLSLFFRN